MKEHRSLRWFAARYVWWRSRLHGLSCRWHFVKVDHEYGDLEEVMP